MTAYPQSRSGRLAESTKERIDIMKRILVCEDEDVIRDFVVINLKRAGYDVVDVNCGEEAIKVFDSEHFAGHHDARD